MTGEVESTLLPLPVLVVVPVPPLATGSVPVTAVVSEMFESVLLAPLMVLFVSVAVAVAESNVSGVVVTTGKLRTVLVDCVAGADICTDPPPPIAPTLKVA